jgi:hypothetical protein
MREHYRSYRSCLHPSHLGDVVLVINTIAQHVAEGPQSTFQGICCAFFLGLLEGRGLALAILDMPVADILKEGEVNTGPGSNSPFPRGLPYLVESAIPQSDSHDYREA